MNAMPFANYEGFKELFVRNDGQRKNRVLLAYLKTSELRKYIRGHVNGYFTPSSAQRLLRTNDMPSLFSLVDDVVRDQSRLACEYYVNIMGSRYGSNLYKSDGENGICVDGDIRAYRYINVERERVFKMKIGKMYTHLIGNSEFGRLLPEQVVKWMAEEMTRRWEAYASSKLPSGLTLHVDDDFAAIYNWTDRCEGDFGSCMAGHSHWSFYNDAVKAKAAYLTNKDGKIVARCVIFTEVHDADTDEIFRLAERQYSTDGDELLKRTLVHKLIEAGEIDGYKTVGADCGASRSFVTNDGESMSSRDLWIECYLDWGDELSYQDSFKSYDMENHRADNYGEGEYDLATTNGELEDEDDEGTVYSEFHGRSISEDDASWVDTRDDYFYYDEVVTAYVYDGRGGYDEETCYEDDVIEIDGEYYYAGRNTDYPEENGICTCPECGNYFIPGETDCYHSELLDKDYCCEDCARDDERNYQEENGWAYSEYDDEYYEDADEVTKHMVYKYNGGWVEETISWDSLDARLRKGKDVEDENGVCWDFFCLCLQNDSAPGFVYAL